MYARARVILLTGATGLVGRALLARLTRRGDRVRCLVRDPRRLGVERVRVQIALGDLADPPSFRHALRGVETVVHLAAATRDQPRGSIEELTGVATWRMVRAAERAGVRHFVVVSALGAAPHAPARVLRAKALAERAVRESLLAHTVFAPSLVYQPGDRWITLLERAALAPAVPLPTSRRALFQPIWAEDVADCLVAGLDREPRGARYELAGPDTLSIPAIARIVLRAAGRGRTLLPVPAPVARRVLQVGETLLGSAAPAVPAEAELLAASMLARRGTADAESLGVVPQAMGAVLGAGG